MLLVHDDEVAVANLLVDHRVAADAEDEMVARAADQVLRNTDGLGHVNRLDRHACGHRAKQGQGSGPRKDLRRHELYPPTLVVGALDVPFALEVGEVFVDRGEGVIVKLGRDLLEARRVAVLLRVGREVSENLPLAFRKRHTLFRGWFENGPARRSYRTFAEFLR